MDNSPDRVCFFFSIDVFSGMLLILKKTVLTFRTQLELSYYLKVLRGVTGVRFAKACPMNHLLFVMPNVSTASRLPGLILA